MKPMRFCAYCRIWFPLDSFYTSSKGAVSAKCRGCAKKYAKKWRQKLKQKVVSTTGKKSDIEKKRIDYHLIPDIFVVGYGRSQTYQHRCLKCGDVFFCFDNPVREAGMFCDKCPVDYSLINDDHKSASRCIGRVVGWIVKLECIGVKRSYKNYNAVFKRDNFTCQYCGYNTLYSQNYMQLHIDHIKPFAAGGNNSMGNLVVACRECNLCASDKWFSSMEDKKKYIVDKRAVGGGGDE